MAENIDLFANDGKAPVIPTVGPKVKLRDGEDEYNQHSVSHGASLISVGVEEAISGEMVKSVIIPETLDIGLPNYVLDFRGARNVRDHCLNALEGMLTDDGDTHIYIWLDKSLSRVGMGIGSSLDRILAPGMQSMFGGMCRIYQDAETGKPVREIKQQDPSKIRLRL